jgi:hypothetical protein
MNKRALGNALSAIGSPAMLGVFGVMGAFTGGGNPKQLLWAVPLAVVSFPVLPFYLHGEKILNECNHEDFIEMIGHLPRIAHLPNDHLSIEEFEGEFFIDPLYYTEGEEKFTSLADARKFIESLGYQEVVYTKSLSAEHAWEKYPLQTYWIKPDKEV